MAHVALSILKSILLLLKRVVRRGDQYVRARQPPEPIAIEKFVFSDETSDLSAEEYAAALKLVDWIKDLIRRRDDKIADQAGDDIGMPAALWDPTRPLGFQVGNSVTNTFTCSDLVLSGDVNVLRKLRLYSQAFTGYQLATLESNLSRPWIRKPLPENVDQFLRLIATDPDDSTRQIPGICRKLPERLRISPPRKFGEIGWQVDGRILNYDSYSYLVELCLMHENGVLDAIDSISKGRPCRILEIGGGYGGLAYYLMKVHSNVHYAIVDIPESLVFSSIYLTTLFPRLAHAEINDERSFELADTPGFTFIPNFLFDGLMTEPAAKFDLVINTLSFNEMTDNQIAYYSQKIKEHLRPAGMCFEHNCARPIAASKTLETIIGEHFSGRYTRCHSSILSKPAFRNGEARIWRHS